MQNGKIYHVYNRANGIEDLFREEKNYQFFMEKYIKYISPVADTYAFCLMPNHFHLMIRIKDDVNSPNQLSDISRQFSNLFNSYSKAINKAYDRNGSLFQRPFKKKEVVNDAYFTQLLLYIHLNPVKHGFVQDYHEWPYGSYQLFIPPYLPCFEGIENILLRSEVLEWFGGDISHFINAHEEARAKQLQSVFD